MSQSSVIPISLACLAALIPLQALAEDPPSVPVAALQGPGHFSPWEGKNVRTTGVVTAVDPKTDEKKGRRYLWIEDPQGDGDLATSEGLFIDAPLDSAAAVGETIELEGQIEERGPAADLPLTTLVASRIGRLAASSTLPPPVLLGRAGRRPPGEVFDDDGLRRFEPMLDGLDFWESLESMRVLVRTPRVVGPTLERNELVVVADSGRDATVNSRSGGVVMRPGDDNPERVIVSGRLGGRLPEAKVGDLIAQDLPGLVDFAFGNYRLLATGPPLEVKAKLQNLEQTLFLGDEHTLTIATFNVENLSARDDEARFEQLARQIVVHLKAPDILALQEIQDDSGPENDGVVDASLTLGKLVAAIAKVGGPRYDFRQVNPLDNTAGGQPGSNIRPVFLFQPARVSAPTLRPQEEKDALRQGQTLEPLPFSIDKDNNRVRFSHSPHRFDHPAFEADESRGFNPSRKPLLLQVQFKGHDLFLINAHLRSRRGDDSPGARNQPPRYLSEDQRSHQALVLRRLTEEILDQDWEAKIVVLGDMNEHDFRTPMRILAGTRMRDLVELLPVEDRYTFNYLGNAQTLDHIFVSPELMNRAQARIDVVHINADFPEKERASDHDPLITKLSFRGWGQR